MSAPSVSSLKAFLKKNNYYPRPAAEGTTRAGKTLGRASAKKTKKLMPLRLAARRALPVRGWRRHQHNALPAGLGRADSRKLSLPPNQLILSLLPQPVGRLRSVEAPS